MAEAARDAAIDPLKESGAMTTIGGCARMRVGYDKGGLLSITKVRDGSFSDAVTISVILSITDKCGDSEAAAPSWYQPGNAGENDALRVASLGNRIERDRADSRR